MEYIRFALSKECQPDQFEGDLDDTLLDRTVLDERCMRAERFLENVSDFLSNDFVPDENTKNILSVLNDSLGKFDLSHQRFVLSLSGGVDSMCLLLLSLKLRLMVAAVHIRHSSRLEDTEKELQWVQFVCRELQVPLYYHHVLVSRPHASTGEKSTDLSRDQFEEYTRQIRFGMYRKTFEKFNAGPGTANVLIGHHLDDIDENRIAELGKGNLVNVDGMAEDDEHNDGSPARCVVVLRPLCMTIRKAQLRAFAKTFMIPHMRNSTPKWSKRGWIRDVLDQACADREWIIRKLDELGKASRDLDVVLDMAVEKWLSREGLSTGRHHLKVSAKSRQLTFACSVININSLFECLLESFNRLKRIAEDCNMFSSRWNEKVNQFSQTEDRKGSSCPIQRIPEWDVSNESELRIVLLTRVLQKIFVHLQLCVPSLDRYVSKKSVSQLVENLTGKTPKVWINWKLNNMKTEIPLVQYEAGVLAILNPKEVEEVVQEIFRGNRDPLRKTIASNLHRITLS